MRKREKRDKYAKEVYRAFDSQKGAAKDRGIDFNFSVDEWVAWWVQHLGQDWMKMRGCRRGQYVMARKKDAGAYEPSNVECILCEDNHSYRNKQRPNWGHVMRRLQMSLNGG